MWCNVPIFGKCVVFVAYLNTVLATRAQSLRTAPPTMQPGATTTAAATTTQPTSTSVPGVYAIRAVSLLLFYATLKACLGGLTIACVYTNLYYLLHSVCGVNNLLSMIVAGHIAGYCMVINHDLFQKGFQALTGVASMRLFRDTTGSTDAQKND